MDEPVFAVLTAVHAEDAALCLASQFAAGEPMIETRGMGPDDFAGFAGIHCARAAACGEASLSTVAIIDGELAAVCVSEDLMDPLVPEADTFYATGEDASGRFKINMDRWGPVLALLGGLDESFLETEEKDAAQGQLFHQFMVAVNPKFQKRGLCRKIMEANLAVAKARGFRRSVIECTGRFSHAAALKCGYKENRRVVYGDFVNPEEMGGGGKVFAKTAENTGHDACVLSTLQLQDGC